MRTPERFWEYVNRTDGCWLWTGGRGNDRGVVNWHGKTMTPYRVSLELAGVTIPAGYGVHHLCEVPLCVRPDHLKLFASHAEHAAYHHRPATHCSHGHPLEGDNLGVVASGKTKGLRYCRLCLRLRARKYASREPFAKRFVTPELRAEIVAMFSQGGHSKNAVAKHFGVSARSVTRALDPEWTPFVPVTTRPAYAGDERRAA